MSLNVCTIMGRMVRDPELRRTGSGVAVTSFTLAVDRDYNPKDGAEKEVDFIDCTAWRSTGEFVSRYFQKGSMIIVSGRLQIRTWVDKDSNKRRNAEVVADSVYFGDSKKSSEGNSTYQAPNASHGDENPYASTLAYAEQLQANGLQSDFAMLEDTGEPLPL